MRLTHLMYHMYHMLTTGPMDEPKWELLRFRGLVTTTEMEHLRPLAKAGAAICVWCNTIVEDMKKEGHLHWRQAIELNRHIGGARGLAAKQIAYTLTGVPVSFFTMLWCCSLVLLASEMWNSALRATKDLLPEIDLNLHAGEAVAAAAPPSGGSSCRAPCRCSGRGLGPPWPPFS